MLAPATPSFAQAEKPVATITSPAGLGSLSHETAPWPQMVGALLVVIVVILTIAWGAKRLLRLPARSTGALRVLAALSMGPREKLVLVQVGTTQLLLGVAPGRIEPLHVLDEPLDEDALHGGLVPQFAEHLSAGAVRGLAALRPKRAEGGPE